VLGQKFIYSGPHMVKEIDALLKRLFPICRSITGNGVRKTLSIIRTHVPLKIKEVPTGTKVFDWTVPKEWNIKDAYIKDPSGEKIVDFKKNNLHIVGYSIPVNTKMKLSGLKKHLHSIPEKPSIIPYKTSYYKENWGFCVTHEQLTSLKDGTYEVVIDSSLKDGSLTYGELLIPGKSKDEVLISCGICHPSMANDSLSGVVLATLLAKELLKKKGRYSYRFLFIPETIGAIVWLAGNKTGAKRIKHGLVATCLGDSGQFNYKKSRAGNASIDTAVEKALKDSKMPYSILDYWPTGSDERQFNSPGFSLPIGSLMRSVYGHFPEYHTSGDNLDFVKGKYVEETLRLYAEVIFILENDALCTSRNPFCEPQLGPRGLYDDHHPEEFVISLLWLANYSDGKNTLLDIANIADQPFRAVQAAAESLEKVGFLRLG